MSYVYCSKDYIQILLTYLAASIVQRLLLSLWISAGFSDPSYMESSNSGKVCSHETRASSSFCCSSPILLILENLISVSFVTKLCYESFSAVPSKQQSEPRRFILQVMLAQINALPLLSFIRERDRYRLCMYYRC